MPLGVCSMLDHSITQVLTTRQHHEHYENLFLAADSQCQTVCGIESAAAGCVATFMFSDSV